MIQKKLRIIFSIQIKKYIDQCKYNIKAVALNIKSLIIPDGLL